MNLLNFNKHSYEACIVAVKKDGNVLQYIEDQTPDMCLMAVNQDDMALQHVKERTPEICMAAVEKDDMALQYVKERTPEICAAAVNNNKLAHVYSNIYNMSVDSEESDVDSECSYYHIEIFNNWR